MKQVNLFVKLKIFKVVPVLREFDFFEIVVRIKTKSKPDRLYTRKYFCFVKSLKKRNNNMSTK